MGMENGTLVVIFPEEGFPLKPCLGIIDGPVGEERFWVKIDDTKTERTGVDLPNKIIVKADHLRRVADLGETLGKRSVTTQLLKHLPQVLAEIVVMLGKKAKTRVSFAELAAGTLVVVKNKADAQATPCWGIVKSAMPNGGKFDVTLEPKRRSLVQVAVGVGKSIRRWRKRGEEQVSCAKVFVSADDMIPVLQTGDGNTVAVRRTVIKNVDSILMIILLNLFADEQPGPD